MGASYDDGKYAKYDICKFRQNDITSILFSPANVIYLSGFILHIFVSCKHTFLDFGK